MKNFLYPAVAIIALSACDVAQPLPVNPGVVPAKLVGNAPVGHLKKQETSKTTVRAYQAAKTADGKDTRIEVVDAVCTLESDHLKATVKAPQVVALPQYDQDAALPNRGVPPSILVTCRKDGLRGSELLAADPGTVQSGGSGNLIVDLVALGVSAAIVTAADWRYEPTVTVMMQ